MPNNKFEFNEIVEKAAKKKIPKLIGSLVSVQKFFKKYMTNLIKRELMFLRMN